MWPNSKFPVDLATFTEEIVNRKFHFLCIEILFSRHWLTKIICKCYEDGNEVMRMKAPGSKTPTSKFCNKLNFLRDTFTNRVTTTTLAMKANDNNASTPPGSQTFSM